MLGSEVIKAREIHEANIDAPVSPFQPYEISSCMLPEVCELKTSIGNLLQNGIELLAFR